MKKIIALSILLFFSCEDIINIDTEYRGKELTIDGRITNRYEKCKISLKQIDPFFKKGYSENINTALIVLFENNKLIDTLSYNSESNLFISKRKHQATLGNTYKIEILHKNRRYIAEDKMRDRPNILNSIVLKKNVLVPTNEIAVVVNLTDPKGIGDLYYWPVYLNGVQLEHLSVLEDKWVDGNNIHSYYLGSEANINKETDQTKFLTGDTIIVEQVILSNSSFDFFMSIFYQIQNSLGIQYGTPPASAKTNLYEVDKFGNKISSSTSHGLFYCGNVASDTLVLEPGFRAKIFQ
jgi:hypothetical protein